jgi:hypothetical protein
MKHHIPRYSCSPAWMGNGGGLGAIAAAIAAAEEARERRDHFSGIRFAREVDRVSR